MIGDPMWRFRRFVFVFRNFGKKKSREWMDTCLRRYDDGREQARSYNTISLTD